MRSSRKTFSQRHGTLIFIVAACLLRLLMDRVYVDIIHPQYAYMGFTFNPSPLRYLLSWMLLGAGILLTLPFLKMRNYVVSNAAIMLFAIAYIPWDSFLYLKEQQPSYIVTSAAFYLCIFLFLRIPFFNRCRILIPKSINAVYILLIVLSLIIVYISGVYTHFRFTLSLANVYDWRMEAREFNLPIILDYLWSATSNILPILLVFFISNKKWPIVALIALVIIINFGISGSKSTLFKMFLCFLLYFVSKGSLKNKIVPLVALVVAISWIEFKTLGTGIIGNFVVRRTFYVPAYLDSLFYDVIHLSGPLFFSHEVYGQQITFYIGDVFFGKDEMRANNGLFSDAYMNLGLAGIVLYPMIYSFLFHLCEVLFRGQSTSIKFFATLMIVLAMRASEITTVLLTHGIFLLCLVIAVLPSNNTYGNRLEGIFADNQL